MTRTKDKGDYHSLPSIVLEQCNPFSSKHNIYLKAITEMHMRAQEQKRQVVID
jgi:hypothetical protein